MASELKVNKITPESGVTLTLGDSGDTINFGSGVLPNFENLTVTGDLTVDTNSLKVDSTNNFVGIGTATPAVALDVVGAITATGNITGTLATAAQPNITSLGTLTSATVSGDLTVDTDTLYVDSTNNRVGIGTTSPADKLHIYTSGNSKIILETTSSVARTQVFGVDNLGNNNYALGSNNNTDTEFWNYKNGFMRFATNSTERMRIDSSGNVGIGTSSPTGRLTVDGGSIHLGNNGEGLVFGSDTNLHNYIFGNASSNFIGIYTANSERMRIDSSGNIGIGDSNPDARLHIQTSGGSTSEPNVVAIFQADTDSTITTGGGSAIKFRGKSSGGNIPDYDQAMISSLGQASNNAHGLAFYCKPQAGTALTKTMSLDSGGNLSVIGSISKGSGSFRIDHPLPEKTNTHNLIHSFVEAPQADNIYRGKVDLVNGTATVNIDTVAGMSEGTFILLNREIQCFTSNETGWTAVKGSVSDNILTITAQDKTCADTISWLVIGERQDQHMYDTEWTDENGKVIVEPLK